MRKPSSKFKNATIQQANKSSNVTINIKIKFMSSRNNFISLTEQTHLCDNHCRNEFIYKTEQNMMGKPGFFFFMGCSHSYTEADFVCHESDNMEETCQLTNVICNQTINI